MKTDDVLCPFSKPILGKWCQCQYAVLAERCSGKMSCTRSYEFKASCMEWDDAFKTNMQFILGVNSHKDELTHAQLMKIRCGSLLGVQKVLKNKNGGELEIRQIMEQAELDYGSLSNFPFKEIVQDVKKFKHRK